MNYSEWGTYSSERVVLMKIRFKYIMIILLVVIIILGVIVYRGYLYYPDIQIEVSGLYNEHSRTVCLNNDYYRINDGNIYNLDNQKSIYQTSDKYAFMKPFGNLLWIIDNSTQDNLKALNSSGKVVKKYSIPNYTKDFFINDNVIFCVSSNGIEIYKLYDDGHKEQLTIDYSFVFESENSYFKLYKYSCEYGECLYFDMDSDNYTDSYFAVDSNNQNMISSNGRINLLLFETDRIVYTESLFQIRTLYEYSFVKKAENCHIADVSDYAKGFFVNTPYFSDEKYIISVAQTTTSRSIGRNGGPTSTSCEMSKHKSDHLYIINTVDCTKSLERNTKTFERILYADNKKAITYYNGKYLTYSLDDWRIIASQEAVEIQNRGSYTFETCGDYIFIFDSNSDELLNRISIID